MNQKTFLKKFSILSVLALVASMNVHAQRHHRGGGHHNDGGHGTGWGFPPEVQQVTRINQTISHGQQINLTRQMNLDTQRGMDLVAIKIQAEDLSYRGSSQLTLLANQRVVQTVHLTSSYSNTETIIIPQHIAQARIQPTLTLEVRGIAHVSKVTAVLQDSLMGGPVDTSPQVTIRNINQKVYHSADISLRREIGRTEGKQLIGLRVLIQKRSHRSASLQILVNGRAVARPVIVRSGTQSIDMPIGLLQDMVMGEDARSVKLAVDGELTVVKIIARTRNVRGGRHVSGGNSYRVGNGHNGRSGNRGGRHSDDWD